jgi:hypothetical protein
MSRSVLRLLPCALIVLIPNIASGQSLDVLNGSWALDRAVSTFGPGDPGAAILDIRVLPQRVMVIRTFSQPQLQEPSVWELPLDGSTLPPPKDVGSAAVIDGKLVITFKRLRETATHVYTVEDDTLTVDRTIRTISDDTPDFVHTMVYRRSR